MVAKLEWERILAVHHNKCVICGGTERMVGKLEQAHLKARSKGGSQVVPMCANHHGMYDRGDLSSTQLKKLGIKDKTTYNRIRPAKKKKPESFWGF
jgi:predicted restriction endonuclease